MVFSFEMKMQNPPIVVTCTWRLLFFFSILNYIFLVTIKDYTSTYILYAGIQYLCEIIEWLMIRKFYHTENQICSEVEVPNVKPRRK